MSLKFNCVETPDYVSLKNFIGVCFGYLLMVFRFLWILRGEVMERDDLSIVFETQSSVI